MGRINGTDWKKPKTELREWYTLDQEAINKMEKEVENRMKNPILFRGMMGVIAISQERHLKRSRRILLGKNGKEEVLAAPWMDRQGQLMIRMRKLKSRAWRHSRKKNAPRREQRALKRKYELQKRITAIYLGKRKGNWEKEKILKARKNSKIL